MELSTVVSEKFRMCKLEHGPKAFYLELDGKQIGNTALIAIPGHSFSGAGVQVKDMEGLDAGYHSNVSEGFSVRRSQNLSIPQRCGGNHCRQYKKNYKQFLKKEV